MRTITDPAAYLLAEEHVGPALRRLYLASAVALAASRSLDDFLVARPDVTGADTNVGATLRMAESAAALAGRRQALRSDLVGGINRRLQALRPAWRSGGSIWWRCCRRWRRRRSMRC